MDCDPKSPTLSGCVRDYLDKTYPNCSSTQLKSLNCSPEDHLARSYQTFNMRFDGLKLLTNKTGCQVPCNRRVYELRRQFTIKKQSIPNNTWLPDLEKPLIVMQKSPLKKLVVYTQGKAYGLSAFLADLGGLFGLLLGLSLWGIINIFSDSLPACKKCLHMFKVLLKGPRSV